MIQFFVVWLFGLGRRDVADRLEYAAVVEPVDPVQGGVFERFQRTPWASPMDDLGLVEPVDRLGQGVVVVT